MLFAAEGRNISLVIFDLDGTLYDQRLLRLRMAMQMGRELPWSSGGRRKLGIIRVFRNFRESLAESEAEDIADRQYTGVASRLGISADEVREVIGEWLLRRPLPLLASCREPHIERIFALLRQSGRTIAVLSDYPAHDKLKALGLRADIVVAATDLEVNRFKPHPRGLLRVLQLADMAADHCLVIGDRVDRDGECARRGGARFLLKGRGNGSIYPSVRSYADLLSGSGDRI
jgi:FMN phosphatase YigB (HAD superfamily)